MFKCFDTKIMKSKVSSDVISNKKQTPVWKFCINKSQFELLVCIKHTFDFYNF